MQLSQDDSMYVNGCCPYIIAYLSYIYLMIFISLRIYTFQILLYFVAHLKSILLYLGY